jgi:hypothetical protein
MRGRILIATVAATATLAAAYAGAAGAGTSHTARFSSFGFRVSCGQNVKELGGVTCYSAALPSTELDGYALLRRHGTVHLGERGDSPLIAGHNSKLGVGDRWGRVGVHCVRKAKGVRCHNDDGHGIRLSPNSYQTF